jgi:Fe2+ or Zn2+ uptake regulation protein
MYRCQLNAIDLHVLDLDHILPYNEAMKKVAAQSEHHKNQLRKAGLKATPNRLAVLALLTASTQPLSVADILARLNSQVVDPATLYRMLPDFAASGLVRIVDLRQPQTFYEAVTDHHHHHLVCESCHTIVDLPHCDMETYAAKMQKKYGFTSVTSHALELFGLCKDCGK